MKGWHEAHLRVRFEETDMMGVVYYAKFLIWMEVGRISLLRDKGLAYGDWVKMGFHIPVVQAHADYVMPARLDDEITVLTRVSKVGRSSVKFENKIYRDRGRKLLCTGHTVHALVGEDGRSTPFPDGLRERLTSS